MFKTYTHEVGLTIRAISGEYEVEKEDVIEFDGEKILYSIAIANMDSSCCGTWGCRYALVHGYIRQCKTEKNGDGLWVSKVETIKDDDRKEELQRILTEQDNCLQIQFQ